MYLRRLRIDRLPGIEPGFTFEAPSDGLNIVTGPNAIGKSSLARALGFLLSRGKHDPADLQLEAEFASGDARWAVTRLGTTVNWRRNGEASSSPPALPGASRFGQYLLSVERLLGATDSDKTLAGELWRTLRGGYDLVAVRPAIGKFHGKKEAGQLQRRESVLLQVERDQADLRRDEARLPVLESRIKASASAQKRCETLRQALELHAALEQRKARQAALDAFPAGMDKLRDGELERVSELETKKSQAEDKRRDAQRELDDAKERLAMSGFEDQAPTAEEVANAEAALKRVGLKAVQRDAEAKQLLKTEAALKVAVKAFKPDLQTQPSRETDAGSEVAATEASAQEAAGLVEALRLDADSLERACAIAEPLAGSLARERELTQRLKLAGEPVDDNEIGRYRDGARLLREWLAAAERAEAQRPRRKTPRIVLAAGALVLLALLALAVLTIDFVMAAGLLASLTAVGVALWLSGKGQGELARRVEEARHRFDATGLAAPSAWDRGTVEPYLRHEIEPGLDRLRLQQERAAAARPLRAELQQVRDDIGELEAARRDFAAECGLDPELTGAPLLRFMTAVKDFNSAHTDHAKQLAAVVKFDEEIAAVAAQARDFVHEWRETGAPPLADSDSEAGLQALQSAWDALRARLGEASEASTAIEAARTTLRTNSELVEQLAADIARVFHDAGITLETENQDLDPGQRRELMRRKLETRLGQLVRWREADKALTEAEGKVKGLRQLLDGEPASVAPAAPAPTLVEVVGQGEVASVDLELRTATETANDYDASVAEKAGIEALLKRERAGQRLEEAAAARGQAAAALEDKREEALLAAATNVLLDDVEGAFRSEHEPKLLKRARERFEQATAREFTLELRDRERFVATDTKQGEKRELAELSSGTRMQLLLALRLAWTEETESGGEALPLFLDEALTASDESRFTEIARTLARLADDERRQIFYLSARRQDAALWEHAIGGAPAVIDLAEMRFAARDPVLLPPLSPPPRVPPPAGMDDAAYAAAIGVPRVDPRREPAEIHVFHLLRDDLKLLHTLLDKWRIAELGPLETLLASNAAKTAVPDDAFRRTLQARCRAARAWTAAWREGRGRPVDRIALEQADGVTAAFIDRVADFADKLGGDGTALVDGLKTGSISRFRSEKAHELEAWLVDQGYIDRAEILNGGGRRLQALQMAAADPRSDPADLNRAIDWLEAALADE